jgi:hypothetical protein
MQQRKTYGAFDGMIAVLFEIVKVAVVPQRACVHAHASSLYPAFTERGVTCRGGRGQRRSSSAAYVFSAPKKGRMP